MKRLSAILGLLPAVLGSMHVRAAEVGNLKVLYVGEPSTSRRAKQVTGFIGQHVDKIESVDRHAFKQPQADGFDVVVLDWPQSDKTEQERQQPAPLGARATWTKPTVLLGSAGLNMAIVWKVRGGSG